jgi:TRAP-type C4-dicarboxylate transport system substrate-binding protein
VVLTLANFLPTSEEVAGFAAEVSRLSGGRLRIDVRSGWRYGQVAFETGLIRDVQAGKADLGIAGSRAWDSVGVTSFRALGAPLLIDSYTLQQQVLASPLVAQMLKGVTPLGLVGLGVLPGQLRHPAGIVRPLRGPSDYAGLRFGVQQSRVGSATLRALGATPVWFPASGPPAGLGGVEQSIGSIDGVRYRRVRFLTTNVVLWPRPLVVFANRKTFDELTPGQRHILTLAARDDLAPETVVVRGDDKISIGNLCRSHVLRFVTASPSDLASLGQAVRPVYAELDRDPQTRRFIAQIEVMRQRIPPEPTATCPHAAPGRAGPGPLDGVYQYTVTYAELAAAHPVSGELVPENVGKFTFVLDRGHFATTTENPQACIWGYGTFTVRGDIIQMLFANGGGIAPTGGTNTPGELFRMQWSLYRDELTMRRGRIPNTGAPTPFIAEPWRRVSTTPSAQFLSKRCPPPGNALPH